MAKPGTMPRVSTPILAQETFFYPLAVSSYSVGEKKTPPASKIVSANGKEQKAGAL